MSTVDDTGAGSGVRLAGLARVAGAIALVTVGARLVGLLRVFVLTRTVGGDLDVADAYLAANTIPNILFEVVAGGALAALVVPALAGHVEHGDREAASRTASALLTWTVLLLVPLAVAGALLHGPVIRLLTDDPVKAEVGGRMLLVFMPQVVLYGVGIVLAGVLQAHRRFLGPALAPLLSSALVIGAYLAYDAYSDRGLSTREELTLSIGTTLGVVVLSLSLVLPASRLGLRLRPTTRLGTGVARRLRHLAAWAGVGVAGQQLLLGLFLRLADPVEGGVLTYNVAYTAFLLPWAVLAVPLATSAFPTLARSAAVGDEGAFAATAARALRLIVVSSLLAAAVLVAVAEPAARLLLGVRDGAGDVDALARVLRALAPGLPGYAVLALVTRALYARDDGRTPAVAAAGGFAVAAVVALVGSSVGSVSHGADRIVVLGVAHSFGMAVTGVWLVGALRRVSRRAVAGTARGAGIALASGALAAAVGLGAAELLPTGGVLVDVVRTLGAATVVSAVFAVPVLGLGALTMADLRG